MRQYYANYIRDTKKMTRVQRKSFPNASPETTSTETKAPVNKIPANAKQKSLSAR